MEWNPFSREAQENPYPVYRWLRDQEPCYYNEETEMWALSRFDDVLQATLDTRSFSSDVMGGSPLEMFIGTDPPRHTPRRRLISRAFTPRAIASLEPRIREITRQHLDALEGRACFDLIGDFARKLPLAIICEMLGVPEKDREHLQILGDRFLARPADFSERTPPADAIAAIEEYAAYFIPVYHDRRARPRDDLLTQLACNEMRDADGTIRTLNELEFAANSIMLTTAGNETTTKLIGNLAVELWRNPDQRAQLQADQSLIPNAVEESLRRDPPSQWQNRRAGRDVSLHGRKIREGDFVALITGAAGRDEREYPDPDRFDIQRRFDRHLSLGYGHHVCLGKSLARLEARVATEGLLERFGGYEVNSAALQRTYSSNVSGFSSIPVSVGEAR